MRVPPKVCPKLALLCELHDLMKTTRRSTGLHMKVIKCMCAAYEYAFGRIPALHRCVTPYM